MASNQQVKGFSQGQKRNRDVIVNDFGDSDNLSRKRRRSSEEDAVIGSSGEAGKVKRIKLCNFMCHEQLEFDFGERINFISGKNGSGKSAILTSLVVGLGGRTSDTNRGSSLKNLIKHDSNSGSIEITLHNCGSSAYNQKSYGNEITVVRKITEKSSSYRLLSDKGKLITSKRDELSFMLRSLNIQINNPMCILNQDVARSFLSSTTPSEFYKLFLKGTLLDDVSSRLNEFCNFQLPQLESFNVNHLKQLEEASKDLTKLQQRRKKQQELSQFEKEYECVSKELFWSYVDTLKTKINKEEQLIEDYKKNVQNIESKVKNRDIGLSGLQEKLKSMEDQLNVFNGKNRSNDNDKMLLENEFLATKESIAKKMNEIKRIEVKRADALKNLRELEVLFTNQESHSKEIEAKQNALKARKEELVRTINDLKAVKSTTEVHRQQMIDTVNSCNKNVTHKARFLDNLTNTLKHKEYYLRSLKESKDELSVYGHFMPQLVTAVKSSYKSGKFDQMPRGPLGLYLKVKDESWGPAIESFIGKKGLSSFHVHCRKDYEVLTNIIQRMDIPVNQRPSITICKFLSQPHDVRKYETRSEHYRSLLNMLVVSDPVVINTLIDHYQAEKLLLVPSNAEAYPLTENINRVPVNCHLCLTKTGDQIFPMPNYKSYSGTVSEQARFLQVNRANLIRSTEEEIVNLRNDFKSQQDQLQELERKLITARKGLDEVDRELTKLISQLGACEVKLMEIEQEDVPESFDLNVLSEERQHLKGNLNSCEQSIQEIAEAKQCLIDKAKDFKTRLKEFEDKKNLLMAEQTEIMEEIKKVRHEIKEVNHNHDYYITMLNDERRKCLERETKLKEYLKEFTDAEKEAVNACPERIENVRSLDELKEIRTELSRRVGALKKLFGDNLIEPADFELRMENYNKTLVELKSQRNIIEAMQDCLIKLPSKLDEITFATGRNTDAKFQQVLKERNFLGHLKIDHDKKLLHIIIKPDPKSVTSDSPISTLSGGERSFSMVAFIIALWENMCSPFYFLDEFDVFMDEVNRKMVMDLLIGFAKTRPQQQYVFLTPHSTAAEDSTVIKFFRMNDPRANTAAGDGA